MEVNRWAASALLLAAVIRTRRTTRRRAPPTTPKTRRCPRSEYLRPLSLWTVLSAASLRREESSLRSLLVFLRSRVPVQGYFFHATLRGLRSWSGFFGLPG